LEDNPERKSLRSLLLEKRDNTSFDFMKIASEKIQKRLKKINAYRDAQKIGVYYPIGSEVLTQDIIQELLSNGKDLFFQGQRNCYSLVFCKKLVIKSMTVS